MWEAVVSGLTLGIVLAISVGPVIFTIIKQSLVNGKEGGFCFVAGVWLSDIVLVVLSNAFSEAVRRLMEYKQSLGIAGGAFLIAMGVFYIFFKKIKLQPAGGVVERFRKRDMAKIFSSGFLINSLNPNVFFFWLGWAGAFSTRYNFEQRIVIFAVCVGLNVVADIIKVFMAGRLRRHLTLHTLSVINRISGMILIGFGIALFILTIFFPEKIK